MSLLNRLEKEIIEDKRYNSEAQEAIDILKEKLGYEDKDFKYYSGNKFAVLSDEDRFKIFADIEAIPGFISDSTIRASSIGGIRYKGAIILIKPSSKQGRLSAGMDNEDIFINTINQYCSSGNPIDIYLNDKLITKVIRATGVGTKKSLYKKTDVVLERQGGPDFNISIKKDNADMWESADSRYRQLIRDFVEKVKNGKHSKIYFKSFTDKQNREKKDIYTMYSAASDKPISGIFVRISEIKAVKEIVWGDEEVDVVAVRTFKPSDFKIFDNGLHIICTELVYSLKDLENFALWPYLKIRHDSTRDKTFGLRPVVMTERSIIQSKENRFLGKGNTLPMEESHQ